MRHHFPLGACLEWCLACKKWIQPNWSGSKRGVCSRFISENNALQSIQSFEKTDELPLMIRTNLVKIFHDFWDSKWLIPPVSFLPPTRTKHFEPFTLPFQWPVSDTTGCERLVVKLQFGVPCTLDEKNGNGSQFFWTCLMQIIWEIAKGYISGEHFTFNTEQFWRAGLVTGHRVSHEEHR